MPESMPVDENMKRDYSNGGEIRPEQILFEEISQFLQRPRYSAFSSRKRSDVQTWAARL